MTLQELAYYGAIINGLLVQPIWLFIWLKDRNKENKEETYEYKIKDM